LSGHRITAEHAAEFGKSVPPDPPYDRVQLPGHHRQCRSISCNAFPAPPQHASQQQL